MAIVCPSITPTSNSTEEYRQLLDKVTPFAHRVQIDLMDGEFASPGSLDLADLWWPEHMTADIHLMYKNPVDHMETLMHLGPNLVIIHAEAEGKLVQLMNYLKESGVKVGVALLQQTSVESAKELLAVADHVLIFSGTLGSYGGTVDLGLLSKVAEVKSLYPDIEIGWDGGANLENVHQLAEAGVDVINVGGAIQKALYPKDVFENLSLRAK